MGIVGGVVRGALPVSRVGVGLWAWRHRNEIGGWASYVARSAPRVVAGDTQDVLAEGRLRVRLSADKRTRDVEGLDVSVEDGVAVLRGTVSPEVHDAALAIATTTSGIARVRNELVLPRRRRRRDRA